MCLAIRRLAAAAQPPSCSVQRRAMASSEGPPGACGAFATTWRGRPAWRVRGAIAVLVLWILLAPLLQSIGGVATRGDAFMLVGSLAAQLLMVLQKTATWPVWIVVNIVGALLYASQGLYFTSLFYAVLIVMAVTGWRAWSARAAAPTAAAARA